MVVWYNIRPKTEIYIKELPELISSLVKFHNDILNEYDRHYGNKVTHKENDLKWRLELLNDEMNYRYHEINWNTINYSRILSISSFIKNNISINDPDRIKEKAAKRNLIKLQEFDSRFNDFEIEYNYEY